MSPTHEPTDPSLRKVPFIAGGAEGEGEEPNPNETDETPVEGQAPQYVSAADFKSYMDAQGKTMSAMTEAINAMREAASRPPVPAPPIDTGPREPLVTREEYVEAIQAGDVKKVERYELQQEARFQARIGQMERVGTDAIAELNKRTEVGDLPYYKKYKKEIDGIVEALPPNMRMAAGVYKYAHDKVVGEHVAEIVAEEREAALRKPAKDEIESLPGSRSGRSTGRDAAASTPTPRDLGGDDAEEALAFRGITPDQQAQKMGYRSWADYMDKTKEYR